MTDPNFTWFAYGVEIGLRAASVIVARGGRVEAINAHADDVECKRRALEGGPVCGEREYQSWITPLRGSLEVASWTTNR
jgi:hypothetical protein